MFTALLQETFLRLAGLYATTAPASDELGQCRTCLGKAVNVLVEETYPKVKLLPRYEERLRGPLENALAFINKLVDAMPDAVACSRSTFIADSRTNAFFASPDEIGQIFSESQEVRRLFTTNPDVSECWALLCMRMGEADNFGIALEGDQLRREVLQTSISFSDHQVVSPGCSEDEARQALKCCIFRSLVAHIRRQLMDTKKARVGHETQLRVLRGRLRSTRNESVRKELEVQLRALGAQSHEGPALNTLDDYLEFIRSALQTPETYVSRRDLEVHIDRMGVKVSDPQTSQILPLPLTEISVASHAPRIAALVRFPRAELLPEVDFTREADIFLAS